MNSLFASLLSLTILLFEEPVCEKTTELIKRKKEKGIIKPGLNLNWFAITIQFCWYKNVIHWFTRIEAIQYTPKLNDNNQSNWWYCQTNLTDYFSIVCALYLFKSIYPSLISNLAKSTVRGSGKRATGFVSKGILNDLCLLLTSSFIIFLPLAPFSIISISTGTSK